MIRNWLKAMMVNIIGDIGPKNMNKLFDHEFSYPCDRIGPYIDLEGIVIHSWINSATGGAEVEVPEYGRFRVFSLCLNEEHKHMLPKIGTVAKIRVYDSGYSDNQLVSWTSK